MKSHSGAANIVDRLDEWRIDEDRDDGETRRENRRAVLGGFFVFFSVVLLHALILAGQEDLFFPYALVGDFFRYGILALLAFPLWRFFAVLHRGDLHWWRLVFGHIALFFVTITVWQVVYFGILFAILGNALVPMLIRTGLWQAFDAILSYSLLAFVIATLQAGRNLRRQKEREARLILSTREAEISALKAQFRPHFFFNVLNSIYALIEPRPKQAQQMVRLVADLMTQSLNLAHEHFVPLQEELDLIKTYLSIEKIRLGDRLRVKWQIAENTDDITIPPLLLQPLVENAIKHGIAPQIEAGQVEIQVDRNEDRCAIRIWDNGPGLKSTGEEEREGRGLAITRNRLRTLYGEAYYLELANRQPRGFEVFLDLPISGEQSTTRKSSSQS